MKEYRVLYYWYLVYRSSFFNCSPFNSSCGCLFRLLFRTAQLCFALALASCFRQARQFCALTSVRTLCT